MISRQVTVLTLIVGFLCLASGAEIRKILEDLLEGKPTNSGEFLIYFIVEKERTLRH